MAYPQKFECLRLNGVIDNLGNSTPEAEIRSAIARDRRQQRALCLRQGGACSRFAAPGSRHRERLSQLSTAAPQLYL